jgi:hypothetical protein
MAVGGVRKEGDSDRDSDESMLDLKEKFRPLSSFIKNREQMLAEMFRCIRGPKLINMLPDILKVCQYLSYSA